MSNDDITEALDITAKLMELHQENPFKIKAYTNAAYKLSKLRYDFQGKSQSDIQLIEGIGKGISEKIFELMNRGTTRDLEELAARTPPGVIGMLGVKGLGPKKVRQLWLELNIESTGELLYACNENRLIALKGFGAKTQAQVQQSIEFGQLNANKFHYATIEKHVNALLKAISEKYKTLLVAVVGEVARMNEVIEKVEILIGGTKPEGVEEFEKLIPLPVNYIVCDPAEFYFQRVEQTSTPEHREKAGINNLDRRAFTNEKEVYAALGLQYIEPELREGEREVELAREHKIPELIRLQDLKGILHNHTTYSDGVHTLKEMADYCR
jgi:DNA polymerase (family 10)